MLAIHLHDDDNDDDDDDDDFNAQVVIPFGDEGFVKRLTYDYFASLVLKKRCEYYKLFAQYAKEFLEIAGRENIHQNVDNLRNLTAQRMTATAFGEDDLVEPQTP